MWIWILIAAVIIGGIIGYISSNDKNKGENAIGGALVGGIGCGYVLFNIFLIGVGIFVVIWLFSALFG